ncbi:hypothetical protein MTO96_006653 [Rhipicephalus appendiculatus]
MAVRAVPATFAAAFAFLKAAYDGHGHQRSEAKDAFDMPDEQFRHHFHLTKETVWWLCDEVADELRRSRPNCALSGAGRRTALLLSQGVQLLLRKPSLPLPEPSEEVDMDMSSSRKHPHPEDSSDNDADAPRKLDPSGPLCAGRLQH